MERYIVEILGNRSDGRKVCKDVFSMMTHVLGDIKTVDLGLQSSPSDLSILIVKWLSNSLTVEIVNEFPLKKSS